MPTYLAGTHKVKCAALNCEVTKDEFAHISIQVCFHRNFEEVIAKHIYWQYFGVETHIRL